MVQGVLGANVDFEIDISKKGDKLTKFGGPIKSGATHPLREACRERTLIFQAKTEMRKKPRYEKIYR
jgi:hypothetical protein